MKKLFALLVALIIVQNISIAQTLWANSWGGAGWDNASSSIVDDQGYLFCTGTFLGPADLDPSPNIQIFEGQSFDDVFIQKYDNDGNLLWVKVITSEFSILCNVILVDDNSNVYITGEFTGTVDFNPGIGTFNVGSNGEEDIFLLKLDSNGNFLWVNTYGGIADDFQGGISIYNNEIIISGGFTGTADLDPGLEVLQVTSVGEADVFIQKVDDQGDLIWNKVITSSSNLTCKYNASSSNGVNYITGQFIGTTDFDPGTDIFNETPSLNSSRYTLSLSENGEFNWVSIIESNISLTSNKLICDDIGNIITTGVFLGEVDFDPGIGNETFNASQNAFFVQKINSSGNLIWVNSMEGTGGSVAQGVTVDSEQSIIISGEFFGEMDFDPGTGESIENSPEFTSSLFVLSFSSEGAFNSVLTYESPNADASSITISDSDELYLFGNFIDSIDVDPGIGVDYHLSNGNSDQFLLKIGYELSIDQTSRLEVSIMPNPCSKYLYINSYSPGLMGLIIYSINGQIVFNNPNYRNNSKIDLSLINNGIFIIRIQKGNRIAFKRFIKVD